MAADYVRGYPTLGQTLAGFKKGTELVRKGELFKDLKVSAAVLDNLAGTAFNYGVGSPEEGSLFNTTAKGGKPLSKAKQQQQDKLKAAVADFTAAIEEKRAELQEQPKTFSTSPDPDVNRKAIDSAKLLALLMAIFDIIKGWFGS